MQLVFATHNKHKLSEVKSILGKKFSIVSLEEIGCYEKIDETGITLKENSILKAKFIHDKYNLNCFSEDTGLEVKALNNKPGVLSARFAGDNSSSEKNIQKLLSLMENKKQREAQFRTVVTLICKSNFYFVEGVVKGSILKKKRGENGFGYDPIFCPLGLNKSFAEIPPEEKNIISHRAKAFKKLKNLLDKF